MVLLITYDLNRPGQNYETVYNTIKGLGAWWHYLDSTWLVDTHLTPETVGSRLQAVTDSGDHYFVVRLTSDYEGWLPKKAWEWIKTRL